MLLLKNFYSTSSVKCGRQVKNLIAYILWKVSYCREEKGSYESPKVQTIIFPGHWAAVFQPFPSCVSQSVAEDSSRTKLSALNFTQFFSHFSYCVFLSLPNLKLTCEYPFVSIDYGFWTGGLLLCSLPGCVTTEAVLSAWPRLPGRRGAGLQTCGSTSLPATQALTSGFAAEGLSRRRDHTKDSSLDPERNMRLPPAGAVSPASGPCLPCWVAASLTPLIRVIHSIRKMHFYVASPFSALMFV